MKKGTQPHSPTPQFCLSTVQHSCYQSPSGNGHRAKGMAGRKLLRCQQQRGRSKKRLYNKRAIIP